MKTAVIVFPGSNCDRDVAVALERSSGQAPDMLWHRETEVPRDIDLFVVPGGFAYGDYLRAGAVAAHSPVMREVKARADEGTPVLGICNGFQVLTEAGLLPGVLMPNMGLRFLCRDVYLLVESHDSLFTDRYDTDQVIRLPIAHHDGNYFVDDDTLKRLQDHEQIAFRYCDADGAVTAAANPNGSRDNIAGVFNRERRVLGLMPHPERLADPLLGGIDGKPMFDCLAEALS
ncbi:MAG: phosphoribosylformylglycinamidine synthase subunit PurQ [Alphaproteobacteria bacterium]|nr:phosphoribosylformylglycinamidine synthase subunit PurQ [Alphaproteobacteria bacterium]